MEPNRTDTLSNPELREEVLSRADALSLSLTPERIIEIIGRRVGDGEKFWNEKLDLKKPREDNEKRYLNQSFEVGANSLYDYQVPYKDNRIFVSVETLASNIVSRLPSPEVIEAQDTDASRELASNYSKVLIQTAKDNFLKGHLQMVARHLLMGYRLGVVKSSWDLTAVCPKEHPGSAWELGRPYCCPPKIIIDADAE